MNRTALAFALLTLAHIGGCAMEVADVGATEEELLRGLAPAPVVGVWSPPGDNGPDTSHCWNMRDECERRCDRSPAPDAVFISRQCMVDCFMLFQNCVDDEHGEGGPVEPIW